MWQRQLMETMQRSPGVVLLETLFLMMTVCLMLGCEIDNQAPEEDEEKYAPIIKRDNISPSLVGRVLISSEQHFDFEVNIVEDRNIEDKLSARWIYGDRALFSPDHIQNTGTVSRPGVNLEVDLCSYPYNDQKFTTLIFAVTDGEWFDRAGGGPSYTPEDLMRVAEGSHLDYVQWSLEIGDQCN